ncbi:hypothetical protein EDC01DRAFT_710193 [Geopyxis carbonaria]|nr:hypothetical protein EDC01DRAFT_710193 [Geopyxis carbonaria]
MSLRNLLSLSGKYLPFISKAAAPAKVAATASSKVSADVSPPPSEAAAPQPTDAPTPAPSSPETPSTPAADAALTPNVAAPPPTPEIPRTLIATAAVPEPAPKFKGKGQNKGPAPNPERVEAVLQQIVAGFPKFGYSRKITKPKLLKALSKSPEFQVGAQLPAAIDRFYAEGWVNRLPGTAKAPVVIPKHPTAVAQAFEDAYVAPDEFVVGSPPAVPGKDPLLKIIRERIADPWVLYCFDEAAITKNGQFVGWKKTLGRVSTLIHGKDEEAKAKREAVLAALTAVKADVAPIVHAKQMQIAEQVKLEKKRAMSAAQRERSFAMRDRVVEKERQKEQRGTHEKEVRGPVEPVVVNPGEKLKEFLEFRSQQNRAPVTMTPGAVQAAVATAWAAERALPKVWSDLRYITEPAKVWSDLRYVVEPAKVWSDLRYVANEPATIVEENAEELEEDIEIYDDVVDEEVDVDELDSDFVTEINYLDDRVRPQGSTWCDLAYTAPAVASPHPSLHEIAAQSASAVPAAAVAPPRRGLPSLDEQSALFSAPTTQTKRSTTEVEKACLFSASVYDNNADLAASIPQFALLGNAYPLKPSAGDALPSDRRIFQNTNHPSSYFVCGLQGSGKSHTTSCIIENHLLASPLLGSLAVPCSALVFHYAQFTSRATFRPAEVAFLAHPARDHPSAPAATPVNILVSPSNYHGLAAAYSAIPGINVYPLRLPASALGVSALLSLMSFDTSTTPPLYLGQVTKVLRDMAASSPSGGLSYLDFLDRLDSLRLSSAQRGPLQQRLDLLESFLDLSSDAPPPHFQFPPGSLTIVDLSCPFVDESTACVLFNTLLGLYLEAPASAAGKLVAVDEAHKYLNTTTPASKLLTDQLLSIIRQQRHYGARVVVSTQEPTVSPKLMDLASATVVHRFSSPEWFEVLRKHISKAAPDEGRALFESIVELGVGEAVVFAPSAVVAGEGGEGRRLGPRGMRVKMRKRITWDGGKSVMAVR